MIGEGESVVIVEVLSSGFRVENIIYFGGEAVVAIDSSVGKLHLHLVCIVVIADRFEVGGAADGCTSFFNVVLSVFIGVVA